MATSRKTSELLCRNWRRRNEEKRRGDGEREQKRRGDEWRRGEGEKGRGKIKREKEEKK